jgi:hypothetical protein
MEERTSKRGFRSGPAGKSEARPTAVGHATAPPAFAAQRPLAPDPMRATMYGHDVHQFDLDLPATRGAATPSASRTPLVPADLGHGQRAITRQAGAVPWHQSDSFNLARAGEAERLQRPDGLRRSSRGSRPQTRVPVMARVMFAVGTAAVVAAIAIWLLSGSDTDSSSAQPSPAAIPTSPARTPPPAAAPAAPAAVPATTAPPAVPIPHLAAPKIGPRAPTTPARRRTPRKPREAKVDGTKVGFGEDAKAAGATTPPAAEKKAPATKRRAATDEPLPPSAE